MPVTARHLNGIVEDDEDELDEADEHVRDEPVLDEIDSVM